MPPLAPNRSSLHLLGGSGGGLQDTFDSITDLLLQIKPKLARGSATIANAPTTAATTIDPKDSGNNNYNYNDTLITQLYRLANLAESFTEQRPRSNRSWLSLVDDLDREGVNLWNMSGILRQSKDHDDPNLFAALRLAAFRLVQAGMEQKPDIETLLHVLQLASKAGSALADIGNRDLAGVVLASAAKIEDELNAIHEPDETHAQSKAQAVTVYYTSRMEAAFKEGNEGVAQFMLRKITEDAASRLSYLSVQDREQLASKILEIGKAIAREAAPSGDTLKLPAHQGNRAIDAVKWLQAALNLVEGLHDGEETPVVLELKRVILRNLARVYYMASSVNKEYLTKAEVTLNELISSVDDTREKKSPEFQQVRWMRLAVLKGKSVPDHLLLEGFRSLIDHSAFTEAEISDFLQELRGMAQHHLLVLQVTQYLLNATLAWPNDSGRSFVDKILLALIFHCSRDQDHERAIKVIQETSSRIAERDDYQLPKVPTMACQSLLWQFGDRHYNAKAWAKAADWFLLGTHELFKSMSKTNRSKCLRKAALCYIQLQEYAHATAVIRTCQASEAPTHYLAFLIAVQQGLEAEAIQAVQNMVQAKDFDRKMLLLATQLAHDASLKLLLLTVLDSLLTFMRSHAGFDNDLEAFTMIRCIIRLVIELAKQPAADLCGTRVYVLADGSTNTPNRNALVPTLVGHFRTAEILCETALQKKNKPVIFKDLSWLWRTAYNIAVYGCAEWDGLEELLAELFDLSRAFMEAYQKASVTDLDSSLQRHVILASFSSIVCRVFGVRQGNIKQIEARQRICQDIEAFKYHIHSARNKTEWQDHLEEQRIDNLMHVVLVFEAEQRCWLRDWDGILSAINQASQTAKVNGGTFEAVADILWVAKDCPTNVLYTALEAILQVCLDRNCMSVEKFSRWLRAICTILLAKNTPSDRVKAIGYVEQAITVIEENAQENAYPIDERQWLLSTTYNTGMECLTASHLDEAKRWFELATTITRYVPNGKDREQKIAETYSSLLARYGSR